MKKIFTKSLLFVFLNSTTVSAYDWKSHNKDLIQDYISGLSKTLESSQLIPLDPQKFKNEILTDIRSNKQKYLAFDRHQLNPEDVYEMQFALRFYNTQLKSIFAKKLKSSELSKEDLNDIFFEAQILDYKDQNLYIAPKKNLPIYGVQSSEWPLSRWVNKQELYNYQFDSDGNLLYRNLKLRSGDVIVNQPIERPVGIFTATSEDQSSFAHAAMVVFLKRKYGTLPVVVDVYEKGIRAVPLHLFFSSQVIGYGEIYRFDHSEDAKFNEHLDAQMTELFKHEFGYDLSGSHSHKKSLSCTEFISYVLELLQMPPLENKSQIHPAVYQNILNLGFMEQKFNMPNDVFQDSRFQIVGFVDNTISVHEMIVNETLISKFRTNMIEKELAPDHFRVPLIFGGLAIDLARFRFSPLGNLILLFTGFDRKNFPVGAKNILVTVNILDSVFGKAMRSCMAPKSDCYKGVSNFMEKHPKMAGSSANSFFSIHDIILNSHLRAQMDEELDQFNSMFD
ncbi:MAG: YiiX/YebB-like N1pC/P60 family cysteine hydrolase [Pseudobdellovibrionaceae bacterium]